MAIYNLDTINEMMNPEENGILDDLLEACNFMLNTINEGADAVNIDRQIGKKLKKEFARKIMNDADANPKDRDHLKKYANKYIQDMDERIEGNRKYMEQVSNKRAKELKHDANSRNFEDYDKVRKIRSDREKSRAIKETCLYILSVIDEI